MLQLHFRHPEKGYTETLNMPEPVAVLQENLELIDKLREQAERKAAVEYKKFIGY